MRFPLLTRAAVMAAVAVFILFPMGSLAIFGVLAFAMIATRKLDWSAISQRMLSAPAPRAGPAQS